jgi:hypothetical protein
MAGPENQEKYQDFIYLAGSASAEFIADVALCPFEAVKARGGSGGVRARRREKARRPLQPVVCGLGLLLDVQAGRRAAQPGLTRMPRPAGEGADRARLRQRPVRRHAQVHRAGGLRRVRTRLRAFARAAPQPTGPRGASAHATAAPTARPRRLRSRAPDV